MHNDRTPHFLRQRERIVRLLKNYGDIYMGNSEVIEFRKDSPKLGPNTPLNSTVIKRLGNSREAKAFQILDKALNRLAVEKPHLYQTLYNLYLTGEVGEREIEYIQSKAKNNKELQRVIQRHDLAIDWLTLWLLDEFIDVKWPDHTKHLAGRDRLYNQVERVYKTFYDEDMQKTDAVEKVMEFYDGAIGRSTIWKIVKSGEDRGALPKRHSRKTRKEMVSMK